MMSGSFAQINEPFITVMHTVSYLNNDSSLIMQVGHFHPHVQGKRVAGSCQFFLAKDFSVCSLSAVEFICIKTRNAILCFYIFFLRDACIMERGMLLRIHMVCKHNTCKDCNYQLFIHRNSDMLSVLCE